MLHNWHEWTEQASSGFPLPEKDPVVEAQRVVKEAESRGVTLRLLGGIAFRLCSPSAVQENLKRHYVDIDFVGFRRQRKEIQNLFTALGYQPRSAFNAMNGHTRLIFNDFENERRADIFLNVFEMCHKFDFSDRLKLIDLTLPPADLLLTKLQVFEITEREYRDIIAFLKDHVLGDKDDVNTINERYIANLCSEDWGLWRTVNMNLDRIQSALGNYNLSEQDVGLVTSRIEQLRKKLEEHPKSFAWKVRARVGERVKWYELPEQDRELVDSRAIGDRIGSTQKI